MRVSSRVLPQLPFFTLAHPGEEGAGVRRREEVGGGEEDEERMRETWIKGKRREGEHAEKRRERERVVEKKANRTKDEEEGEGG